MTEKRVVPLASVATSSGKAEVSALPEIAIVGGTPAQAGRVEEAVQRFLSAGLLLPDLTISFHDSLDSCAGSKGVFWGLSKGISFCSDEVDMVYEHEMAHAWVAANLTDSQRSGFMRRNGLTVWSSHDVPWKERATERVAVIIQQGVSGLPIPPAISEATLRSVREFEKLTGSPDPRLIDWAWQHAAT